MKELNAKAVSQNINTVGMFDLNKGILMVLVVFGHSFSMFVKYWERENMPGWIILPLLLFGLVLYGLIPMFFLMSGYGFRKQKMTKCFADRVRYLLKPYLWVAVIVTGLVVLKAIIRNKSVLDAVMKYGFPFLIGLCPGETEVFGWYIASIGPMWFLVAMGIGWIILNLLFQMKTEALRIVTLLALIALCTQLPFYAFIPLCIVQSICCAGYLYLGYCVKKSRLLTKALSWKTYAILIIIVVGAFLFGTVDVSQNVWKLGFFDYIASAIAGVLLCKMSVRFGGLEGKIAKFFRVLGRNSLYIFCVHTVEYLVFPWNRLYQWFSDCPWLGILVVFLVRVLIIAVGCIAIHKLVMLSRHRKRR